MKKAQNYSLDDQRGRIDSQHLEIPEFLLTHNLIKSHSISQNLINYTNNLNDSNYESVNFKVFKNSNPYYEKNYTNNLNKSTMSLPITASGFLQNSGYTSCANNHDSSTFSNNSKNSSSNLNNFNLKPSITSRSRSPIVIVYDNDDYNLDKTEENFNDFSLNDSKLSRDKSESTSTNIHQDNYSYTVIKNNPSFEARHILGSPVNYESISESNTPVKSNVDTVDKPSLKRSINFPQSKSTSVTSLDHGILDNSKNTSKISYV